MTEAILPHPTTERWQPLRLGLVDLFYYDDEQFWFHDGRLLLRGNNGTGKSKVLALTLPFLLDGSIKANRVEPDADPKKRMEWNLLLGGAHPNSERTGYSWIEFGRLDEDGTQRFCTLGIGLKAAAGRGIVKTWYFTSSQRIGDLRLLDDTRTVVSQEKLRDALESAGSGHVHTTQEAYRRAVDEALFRLGEERYGALVDLLVQLRQPQLSKRPDEKALSGALTEALAPLDQAVVADVAEAFRSLEDERVGIEESRATLAAAEAFLRHYRSYARVATRRSTTAVRIANSRFEHAGRDLREAEEVLTEAAADVDRLAAGHAAAEERQGELEGQNQALRESPEMREADRLDRAEREAGDAERRARAYADEAEQARRVSGRDAAAAAEAAERHEDASMEAERRDAEALRLARPAGLTDVHQPIATDETAARIALDRRRDQIHHVRRLAEAARDAGSVATQRRTALDAAEAAAARRTEDVSDADAAVEESVAEYRETLHGYLSGLTAVVPAVGPADLAERAAEWGRGLEGDSPAREAVEAAAAEALGQAERARAAADHDAGRLAAECDVLRDRIATLESGHDPEPPAAPGRDAAARETADGAPLWRVTDFADDVPDAERAGTEAALQSAGLLDAWIHADGSVTANRDVVLGPAGPELPAEGSLAAVLRPAVGPGQHLDHRVVTGVLRRIGHGPNTAAALWVDGTGHWGAGPARGAWTKPAAEFVGAGAREAHRQALLGRLREDLAALESALDEARARSAEAQELTARINAERSAYPAGSERNLVTAHERAAAARRELERAEAAVADAETAWRDAADTAEQAATDLAEAAEDLGTGTTTEALDDANAALGAYAEALAGVRSAARAVRDAARAREAAEGRAAEAAETLERREAAAREQRAEAASLRATAQALSETVGASVAELQARLTAVSNALADVATELKRLVTDQQKAAGRHGMLTERVEDLERRRGETAEARERVIDALRVFTGTGLMRVCLPDLDTPDPSVADDWTVTAALAVARTAEQELDGTDESDEAWSRAQQHVSNASTELSSQMSRHGHTAFVEQHGDVLVARVRYLGDELDVDRLAVVLEEQVADRERLLSAREREILENHLVNEVAGHLHELLGSAQGSIDRMNRELADRRTSTGMQLRVQWRERADGPAGLAAARNLMTRSDATWTPQDREAIGDFLQARIAEVREADPTASWQEHLEQALDYRQWHTFVVERRQNGQWRSASGPASGGERVLAMSVPLFAAASSHYNSASPHAPRLILLDEAFAGVDDDSRAKSLGLLATFDLDVVMTSEREWGCYPQVPGLAIAQLSRVDGIDAVGVTRWRWDGRRRAQEAEVAEVARAGGEPVDPVSVQVIGEPAGDGGESTLFS
ncbi:hypothetical protein GCM10027059_45460 [Myceligenerans halotolerans]